MSSSRPSRGPEFASWSAFCRVGAGSSFVVVDVDTFAEAAARAKVSKSTVCQWVRRWRAVSPAGRASLACLTERSSRPHCSPDRVPDDEAARIRERRERTGRSSRCRGGSPRPTPDFGSSAGSGCCPRPPTPSLRQPARPRRRSLAGPARGHHRARAPARRTAHRHRRADPDVAARRRDRPCGGVRRL